MAVLVSEDQGNKWYARSKALEGSDSEDSDGYTEPLEHSYKRPATRLVSGGSLTRSPKNNNRSYAECREQSPWQQENTYQPLHHSSCSDDTIHDDESSYVELFK